MKKLLLALLLPLAVLLFFFLGTLAPPAPEGIQRMARTVAALPPPEEPFRGDVVYKERFFREDCRLDIYYPPVPAKELYDSYHADTVPVLLFFHGGSWLHGDKSMIRLIDPFIRKLRERGIALVAVNYTAGVGGGWKAPAENCRDALIWLRDRGESFGLNPRAVGLYGVSAGAHLALLSLPEALADPGLELRFLLEEFGPTDLEAMARGEAFDASPMLRLIPRRVLRRYSPLRGVEADWPPVLIFHGTADRTVSIEQSRRLAAVLREKGVPYRFQEVPGGDHGFFNRSQAYWRELEDQCMAFLLPLIFPGEFPPPEGVLFRSAEAGS